MEANTLLSVQGMHISFAGERAFTAINNVSFNVEKGKTLAIVGESGSGKSLTALALMGLLPKTASMKGTVLLKGLPASIDGEEAIVMGRDAGMVFQEPMSSLNPIMSVGNQLKEAIQAHQHITGTAARLLAIDWFSKVHLPAPEKMYGRYPHQLSGGQKQRVMIAMALCNHPALLIADEPTTALDATVQQEIIRLMVFLQQERQSAMIFITHDLALAATIADDVLVMYKGDVMEYGPVAQVLTNPQHPYTKALMACRPAAGKKGYRLPVVDDYMAGGPVNVVLQPVVQAGGPLLQAENLQIWFPVEKNLLGKPREYFKAVDDVSFTINKGEVLGLVGESGCGKSTLGRSLVGLLPVHGGELVFGGQHLESLDVKQWRPVRKHIQMIFQDPYSSLNPRMTIGDMLREPLIVHDIVGKAEYGKECRRLLDMVQLPADALDRYPHQFSGGQRQRIGIARALALRPALLICDESVSALDVSVQAQILNLLKELQAQFGLTYLFISHDMAVVNYISDRVMVMQAGKIVESGQAEQVLRRPAHEYTRRLVAAMPGG